MPDETTKQTNFRRLAQKRVQSVNDRIRVLSNLSNTYTYEYDEGEVNQIFDAIQEELAEAREKFNEGLQKRQQRRAGAPNAFRRPRRREFTLD